MKEISWQTGGNCQLLFSHLTNESTPNTPYTKYLILQFTILITILNICYFLFSCFLEVLYEIVLSKVSSYSCKFIILHKINW